MLATAMLGLTMQSKEPSFEVASLRLSAPGSDGMTSIGPWGTPRFVAKNVRLPLLIQIAYKVEDSQIDRRPSWSDATAYDVTAKSEGDTGLTPDIARPMIRQLLEERLHLVVHRETRMVKGFALVVGKRGWKQQKTAGKDGMVYILRDGIRGPSVSLSTFAKMLSRPLGAPVVDKTGIEGNYEIDLKYAPKEDPSSELPSLVTALEEQMGLRLEPEMIPVEFVVIDHLDKVPVEN
jgi:uncharacterized protein (TIGR03435 family)